MGQPAKASTQIRDFPGWVLYADPRDFQPGTARVLTNLVCLPLGQLNQRPGLVKVTFESD